MLSRSPRSVWFRLAPLLVLPGCLVSFNDYPLEATGTDGSTTGASGDTSTGNATTGGSASAGKSSSGSGGESNPEAGKGTGAEPGEGGAGPARTKPAPLIDDFEDGDEEILDNEGRSGTWYAGNDGAGQQVPAHGMAVIPVLLGPPRSGSQRALHTWGGPFQTWGALIGTSLAGDGESEPPYDVSAYRGVRFYVRSTPQSPSAAKTVRFNLPTVATNTGGGCFMCNDHFGAPVTLTPQWQRVEVRFAELRQEGWGLPPLNTPNLTQATSIQFYFVDGVAFDLWVDDVELF